MPDPWDQLPGEPDASYARFLVYRNLGPGRSLRDAYGATKGRKRHPSGHYQREAADYDWQARAQSWDVVQLREQGLRSAVMFFTGLERVLERSLAILEQAEPESFVEAVDVLERMAKYFDPNLVRDLFAEPGPGS